MVSARYASHKAAEEKTKEKAKNWSSGGEKAEKRTRVFFRIEKQKPVISIQDTASKT